MKKFLIFIILLLVLIVNACQEVEMGSYISEPEDPNTPVANAGASQTTTVGSYILFDGTRSTFGSGSAFNFIWTEDSSNPQLLKPVNAFSCYRAALKEGTYKFSLIVNNGIVDSKPAQLLVKVGPRISSAIKDTLLEASIRIILKKQSGTIEHADLLTLTQLSTQYNLNALSKIKKLDGLEHCENLRWLNLTSQNIVDISPLTALGNLVRLNLSRNSELENVSPISNLTNLISLDISFCKITDLSSLSSLKNLEEFIFFQKDQYCNLDLSVIKNMINLKDFRCSLLFELDLDIFKYTKELSIFYCIACNISDIEPLEELKELRFLLLPYNRVEDLSPLEKSEKLEYLDLDGNNVKDLKPLVDNKGLGKGKTILLWNNPLNEISINDYIPQLKSRGVDVIR